MISLHVIVVNDMNMMTHPPPVGCVDWPRDRAFHDKDYDDDGDDDNDVDGTDDDVVVICSCYIDSFPIGKSIPVCVNRCLRVNVSSRCRSCFNRLCHDSLYDDGNDVSYCITPLEFSCCKYLDDLRKHRHRNEHNRQKLRNACLFLEIEHFSFFFERMTTNGDTNEGKLFYQLMERMAGVVPIPGEEDFFVRPDTWVTLIIFSNIFLILV